VGRAAAPGANVSTTAIGKRVLRDRVFFGRHPPSHFHLFEQAASYTARAKEHVK
jgi:hypothetical protein